ncbi:MAG: hypothetical protein ABWY06_16285 [Pseudomonas sp.]|uniref:hypothetical protein n=1 Tax=Pseudomonas sp. TaxID=306 RepID=UPI003399B7FD
MALQAFQVTYNLDGSAKQLELSTETGVLTPEQARAHIESLHADTVASDITDVQIHELDARRPAPGQQLHADTTRH